jgi:hypothetical protein
VKTFAGIEKQSGLMWAGSVLGSVDLLLGLIGDCPTRNRRTALDLSLLARKLWVELGFDGAFEFLTPMPQFWQNLEKEQKLLSFSTSLDGTPRAPLDRLRSCHFSGTLRFRR